jgi:hypothetical protein
MPAAAIAAGAALIVVAVAGALVFAISHWGLGRPVAARAPGPSHTPLLLATPEPSPTPAAQSGPTCPAGGQLVTAADQLSKALAAATPGAVIRLAPGSYAGKFVAKVSGTSDAPITLCGPREAVIDGGSTKSGYSLHLDGASWWKLIGFTVQGGQKGVVTDHVNHDLIYGLYVHGIGDEAVHLRSASTDNIVDSVTVRDTGSHNTKFGEGIYVGSAHSNWCTYSSCGPDLSDRNIIRNCDISQTSAENIDIKEGTTGGTIANNKLSGVGMVASAATAWVNVKGNGWTITGNVGETSIGDGFQVHQVYAGWGEQNVFRGNHAAVNGPGFGYYVHRTTLGTVIGCDNTATGAGSGLANVRCA